MHFTLVRHAQPQWERDGLNINDPTLTDLGRMQAERLGRRFQGLRADVLLVSTMRRARETAEPIASALGLEPEPCPWLEEIHTPPWEDEPVEYVQEVFSTQRAKPVEQLWHGLDGGESFRAFHRRVSHGVQEHLEGHGAERVNDEPSLWQLKEPERHTVIVAHAGTNATAIGYLLGIPPVPWEWERFISLHASVSTVQPIEISGCHAYSLARFADVAHLAPGLQTR